MPKLKGNYTRGQLVRCVGCGRQDIFAFMAHTGLDDGTKVSQCQDCWAGTLVEASRRRCSPRELLRERYGKRY